VNDATLQRVCVVLAQPDAVAPATAAEALREAFADLHPLDALRMGRRQNGVLIRGRTDAEAERVVDALAARGIAAEAVDERFLPALPRPRDVYRLDVEPEGARIPKLGPDPLPWERLRFVQVGSITTPAVPAGGPTPRGESSKRKPAELIGPAWALPQRSPRPTADPAATDAARDLRDAKQELLRAAGLSADEREAVRDAAGPSPAAQPVDDTEIERRCAAFREVFEVLDPADWKALAPRLPKVVAALIWTDPPHQVRVEAADLISAGFEAERTVNTLQNLRNRLARLAEFAPPAAIGLHAHGFIAADYRRFGAFDLIDEFDDRLRWELWRRDRDDLAAEIGE
jgi:hypothetical protein